MNRNISNIFNEKKKVNVGYIVAGYPSTDFTREFLLNLDRTSIDILEIGIPYSDPLADGKLISNASFIASEAGITTDTVFELLTSVKDKITKPLVFLVYYNLVFAYGIDNFIEKCVKSGIKGIIIPDLPFEEAHEISKKLKKNNISFIPLVSVTSKERISKIVSLGDGFIYAIGSLGVTGTKQVDLERLKNFISEIKNVSELPVSLGFGIRNNEDVKKMRQYVDGVIIGTSIVELTSSGNVEFTVNEINKLFEV